MTVEDVRAAAPYFRKGDSLHDMTAAAEVLPILLGLAARYALRAGASAVGQELVFSWIEDRPFSWENAGKSFLVNLGLGGLIWAARSRQLYNGGTLTWQTSTAVVAEDAWNIAGDVGTVLFAVNVRNAIADRVASFAPACGDLIRSNGLIHLNVAELLLSSEECANALLEHFQDELIDMDAYVASTPGSASPLLPLGVLVSDGTNTVYFVPQSLSAVELTYSVVPTETGASTVRLGVVHDGNPYILRTDNLSTASNEVDEVVEQTHAIPTAELLGLAPSDDREFRFFLELEKGAFSEDYFGGVGDGFPLHIDGPANQPPMALLNSDATGSNVRFWGSYFDIDSDAATQLELELSGSGGTQNIDLLGDLETGDPAAQLGFDRTIPLADGVYTFSLHYDDGLHPMTNGDFEIRVSSTPRQVSVGLSTGSATIGQIVPGSVTVTDGAGAVPGVEVALGTDLRSPFFDAGSTLTRKVTTNASGSAAFSYQPTISGLHTLLAMEPSEYEFDYTTLDVAGNPEGWTADWTFSLQSSTATEATYEVQVHIQYQGQPLDPGDYVYFSANHGSFEEGVDQVGVSSIAVDDYTLTAAEADSGSEVFTIDIPRYDISLTHSTNLPVGEPDELPLVGTTSILGDGDERYSYSVAVSADGRYIANVLNSSQIRIRNLGDLSTVRTVSLSGDDPNCLAFSPDGNRLAIGDIDGNISIVTVANGNVSDASLTDGHADIVNLDWYAPNRIAAATQGGTTTNVYTPRVLILSDSPSLVGSVFFSGVDNTEDIRRVTCSDSSQLCAMATDYNDTRWFLFTVAGSTVFQQTHPDGNMYRAFAFNNAGDRLVTGGEDANGATVVDLWSVSASGASPLSDPVTASSDVYAATFLEMDGVEHFALGGRTNLEVFPVSGGAAERSTTDPGYLEHESYHLTYVAGLQQLIAITEAGQSYYNVSGDEFGPSISILQPQPVGYNTTLIEVSGSITDPSGVSSSEYRVAVGSFISLPLNPDGTFEITFGSLPVGDTQIDFRATDSVGNESEASLIVTRLDDVTPPVISQVQTLPSTGPPGQSFEIRCTVSDSETGVDTVEATVRSPTGSIVATPTMNVLSGAVFSTNVPTDSWADGAYTIDVAATDLAASPNTATAIAVGSYIVNSLPIFLDGFESGDTGAWN
ncbi:MAG: hypothetical protein K8J08_22825 [Thermoanaerobaculia bacterium]|nr:hypothetical protein [Thermoanaerobaculia bacterium]